MTIELPADLEPSIAAALRSGQYGSAEELVALAVRSLLDRPKYSPGQQDLDPFLGSMRDAAEELDAIVADVYRRRETETMRETHVD